MKKNKEYKVVKILNAETIIINAGKVDNVKENDTFNILGAKVNVIDPDTKEALGTIQNIKEDVTVTKVFEKMCQCSHFTSGSLANLTSTILNAYGTYKKQLDVDPSEITLKGDEEKTIKIGDIAVLKEKDILVSSKKSTTN